MRPVGAVRLAAAASLALLCASCASAPAEPPTPSPPDWLDDVTPELALAAIDAFRADPTAEDARVWLSAVVGFAERDEAVHVTLEPRLFPPCGEAFAGVDDASSLLLGGFIAGNVEPQLTTGVRGDRAVDGMRMMLRAYEALRGVDALPGCESLDRWSSMERNGVLSDLVDELLRGDASTGT